MAILSSDAISAPYGEFVGHSLTDALGMLGIIREVMPRRTPWYKGSVERFFRTKKMLLANLRRPSAPQSGRVWFQRKAHHSTS